MDNSKLIQATYLKDVVGEDVYFRSWARLLPVTRRVSDGRVYHLPSGSLTFIKVRGQKIRDQPWQQPGRFWRARQKSALSVILTRDIGLGARLVSQLVNKPRANFLRIEDFISGVVDSLWLTDENIFDVDKPEIGLIKKLVRKIFAVGCHDLSALVNDWKQWGNNLFHTVAKTQTIGDLEPVRYNNIFRALNGIPFINGYYQGKCDMLLLQHLMHLISSRQMPYMGKTTEIKSVEKYKSVLTSTFKPDDSIIMELAMAARRIGGICRSIHKTPIPNEAAHISVTSSGELNFPITKGGQASAVRDAIERILLEVPETDSTEDTPFGKVYRKAGLPLWQTLFRKEDDLEVQGHDLFEAMTWGFPKGQPGRFWGLDRVTGKQLMYVAWKDSSPTPIVLRASVVPEMGNKARMVTLSPYWVNVIQAPLAHLLIEAMKYHPSVFSSFHRQDQAWEAVRQLVKIKDISLVDQFVLSSDLKDATNAQQFELTKVMLKSFIDGYGLSTNSDYVNLVLGQIGPRLVLFDDYDSVVSSTGIMMGEAIAKPSLTLLNLAIEERAFLLSIGRRDLLSTDLPAPSCDWRCLHIGGDDHLAKGPANYLDLITEGHLRAGSHISPGQHGYSRICVKYCERMINLSNLQYREPIHRDYRLSVIVDTVKVRLLEPGLSTMQKKDNKNVAIGKSQQLVNVLKWLPKDNDFWTYDKKVSIRDLFINRMGCLLPSKALHPRAYAAVHLPTTVGGYGLGFDEEMTHFLYQSPEPFRWLLSKRLLGLDVREELRKFRTLNSNISNRGIPEVQEFADRIIDQLEKYPKLVNALSWKELTDRFPDPDKNARKILAYARDEGLMSFAEYVKWSMRGNLFQDLLMSKPEQLSLFNTRPFTQTLRNIWGWCEEIGLDHYGDIPTNLTNQELNKLFREISVSWFFDINQMTTIDIAPKPETGEEEQYLFVDVPYRDAFTIGLPSLLVGKTFLGLEG